MFIRPADIYTLFISVTDGFEMDLIYLEKIGKNNIIINLSIIVSSKIKFNISFN